MVPLLACLVLDQERLGKQEATYRVVIVVTYCVLLLMLLLLMLFIIIIKLKLLLLYYYYYFRVQTLINEDNIHNGSTVYIPIYLEGSRARSGLCLGYKDEGRSTGDFALHGRKGGAHGLAHAWREGVASRGGHN